LRDELEEKIERFLMREILAETFHEDVVGVGCYLYFDALAGVCWAGGLEDERHCVCGIVFEKDFFLEWVECPYIYVKIERVLAILNTARRVVA
jgi:hypothetical protein